MSADVLTCKNLTTEYACPRRCVPRYGSSCLKLSYLQANRGQQQKIKCTFSLDARTIDCLVKARKGHKDLMENTLLYLLTDTMWNRVTIASMEIQKNGRC